MLKLNIGFNRKVGEPNYSSRGASVNLEIQVMESPPDTHAPKSVVFYTPPATLDAIVGAGIDHVTLGNNHIYDYLDEGLEMTLEALDASPLAWSGGLPKRAW